MINDFESESEKLEKAKTELARSVYDMIDFIPVPKNTYEAILFQIEHKDEEIRRLQNRNKPMIPCSSNPLDYPKQNKIYWCGDCNERISKGDKFCRHCGRAVKWE